jgi:hypothetical protein
VSDILGWRSLNGGRSGPAARAAEPFVRVRRTRFFCQQFGATALRTSRQTVWRNFTTKTALTDAVREIVNPVPFDAEFESGLLSDLIAERHWYCRHHQARPTKFKKSHGWNGGYDFWGWFEPTGWHRVSWRKCITPDKIDDVLKRALRTAIRPIITDYKDSHAVCERCNLQTAEEIDHVNPTLDEMYQKVVAGLGPKEKEQIMALWIGTRSPSTNCRRIILSSLVF